MAPTSAAPPDLRSVLRDTFGLEEFRPGQERIIRSLLAGRDALAVLPTGAGKSLVYQLTSQLLPGVTLVVSPLLALMKDQVESLGQTGIEVGVVNSALTPAQAADELRKVLHKRAKLLYVTPERFEDEEFIALAKQMEVSLFVVDEAHCISEWGHSFRPSYLTLSGVAAQIGRPALLALTATASPWVRRDIVERLGMRQPDVVVRGVDRPNLFLEVRRVEEEREDRRALEQFLAGDGGVDAYQGNPERAAALADVMRGSGIVYTATTAAARETAEWLRGWGIAADYYHGQRKKGDRERVQDGFMSGRVRVIAATNAFGLGVDKPDVRFVIHRDVPASLEQYYQEAGRAGRDGDPARCVIIYRPADLGRAAFLAGGGRLTREEVAQSRDGLLALRTGTHAQIQEATGLSRGDVARLVQALRQQGIVAERRGRVRLLVDDFDPEQVPLDGEERRLAYERSRLEMMRGYVDEVGCRRAYVLNYFGEEFSPQHCETCDNDLRSAGEAGDGASAADERDRRASAAPADIPLALGDRVAHATFGQGTVQRVTPDGVTVLFDDSGYKKLAIGALGQPDLFHRVA
jgi:ATP-dependent DNA helicase RecQ